MRMEAPSAASAFFLLFAWLSVQAQYVHGHRRLSEALLTANNTTEGYSGSNGCKTGNPIDDCWRCDPNWASNRHKLADCAMGFGRGATGGKNGKDYVVTDPSDDPVNPRPGTLRYGVIQSEPLWITFAKDMTIVLQQELIMNSYKTIDGRGQRVEIAGGACITIQYVSNIIIHGVHVHDCKVTGNAMVRSTPNHVGWRTVADGDGISLFGANQVWVDHVTLSRCSDGLIDAIMGSTAITISNSFFSDHDKVMLLGHNDNFTNDKNMQVSVVFNRFAQNLIQRMPRCRHGFFEVVNNDYSQWQMYAVGGSASPTIFSRGNRYMAPNNPFAKTVTMRIDTPQSVWQGWNWNSQGDMLLNGANFVASGATSNIQGAYNKAQSNINPFPASQVAILTANAGALTCQKGSHC